jgi:hypothetical protein
MYHYQRLITMHFERQFHTLDVLNDSPEFFLTLRIYPDWLCRYTRRHELLTSLSQFTFIVESVHLRGIPVRGHFITQ